MKSDHQQPHLLGFNQSAMIQILTVKEWRSFDKQQMCFKVNFGWRGTDFS